MVILPVSPAIPKVSITFISNRFYLILFVLQSDAKNIIKPVKVKEKQIDKLNFERKIMVMIYISYQS